jgi:hypothetical protein
MTHTHTCGLLLLLQQNDLLLAQLLLVIAQLFFFLAQIRLSIAGEIGCSQFNLDSINFCVHRLDLVLNSGQLVISTHRSHDDPTVAGATGGGEGTSCKR